jgi:hypothetical protein
VRQDSGCITLHLNEPCRKACKGLMFGHTCHVCVMQGKCGCMSRPGRSSLAALSQHPSAAASLLHNAWSDLLLVFDDVLCKLKGDKCCQIAKRLQLPHGMHCFGWHVGNTSHAISFDDLQT